MDDNDLTGSIPASLGDLPKLEVLYLARNGLDGEIPSALGNLSKLDEADPFRQRALRLHTRVPGKPERPDLGSLGLSDCKAPEPENVVATSTGATTIDLIWDEVDDTTVYRVEYHASGATEWTLDDDTISSATHTVDGLVCNTAYEFRVSAYGDGETYVADWGSGSEVSATTGTCS